VDAEIQAAAEMAATADQVVILTGLTSDWEGEGSDRESMHLPGRQEDLVRAILAVRKDVVLVNQSGTPIDLRFCEDASAIVQAFYGGMECGNGVYTFKLELTE
jgi:beta-glucosidase